MIPLLPSRPVGAESDDEGTKCNRTWPELEALESLDDGAAPLLPLVPEADRPTHGDAGRRGVCVA